MPKIRALKPMFHGGSLRLKGAVFDVSDAVVERAKQRLKDRQLTPAFELVPQPKAPAADTSDIA